MKNRKLPNENKWYKARLISIRFSFNEVKFLLRLLRNHRTDSMGGRLTVILIDGCKKYIERKIRAGDVPDEIRDSLSDGSNPEEEGEDGDKQEE